MSRKDFLIVWALKFPMNMRGTNNYDIKMDNKILTVAPAMGIAYDKILCNICGKRFILGEVVIYNKYGAMRLHPRCLPTKSLSKMKIIRRYHVDYSWFNSWFKKEKVTEVKWKF